MKGILILLVMVAVVLPSPTFSGIIGNTDKEVRTIADPLLDNILAGMKTNDYAKWSKDFDRTMKEAQSKDEFLKTNKQIELLMGSYESRKYLGFLKQGDMTLVLWKGSFDKTEDDVLIKLVVSKRKGKYVVTGLWFQ